MQKSVAEQLSTEEVNTNSLLAEVFSIISAENIPWRKAYYSYPASVIFEFEKNTYFMRKWREWQEGRFLEYLLWVEVSVKLLNSPQNIDFF